MICESTSSVLRSSSVREKPIDGDFRQWTGCVVVARVEMTTYPVKFELRETFDLGPRASEWG